MIIYPTVFTAISQQVFQCFLKELLSRKSDLPVAKCFELKILSLEHQVTGSSKEILPRVLFRKIPV